jgi:hypothetical protein
MRVHCQEHYTGHSSFYQESMMSSISVAGMVSLQHVLIRLVLRIIILGAFALFGSQGFAKSFADLLVLAAIWCAVVAALGGERVLAQVFSHWDEAAAYILVGTAMAQLA